MAEFLSRLTLALTKLRRKGQATPITPLVPPPPISGGSFSASFSKSFNGGGGKP